MSASTRLTRYVPAPTLFGLGFCAWCQLLHQVQVHREDRWLGAAAAAWRNHKLVALCAHCAVQAQDLRAQGITITQFRGGIA